MAAPPPKRQRRLTLLTSDDEDIGPLQAGKKKTLPTRSVAQGLAKASSPPKRSSKKSPGSKTPSKSPATKLGKQQSSQSPSKSNGRIQAQKPQASKSIQSFFNKKTERQRVGGTEARPIKLEDSGADEIKDDYISDDISDEDLLQKKDALNSSQSQGTKKRSLSGSKVDSPSLSASLPSASNQRVKNDIKHSGITQRLDQKDYRENQRPWAERYGPINLDELAVHKKKVADVKDWLEGVFEHRLKQVGITQDSNRILAEQHSDF